MHLPRSGRRMNKTAIAFGTFDGVHRGHQEIINAMLSAAKRGGLDPLIYTFSNHPAGLFGKSFSMIMTDGERLAALERLAPVAAERLDRQFAAMEPEDFVRHMAEKYRMGAAVAGFNYTFGSRGAGNMDTLRRLGGKYGFEVYEIPALMYGGEPVSSTRIRACIERGDIAGANAMLGHELELSCEETSQNGHAVLKVADGLVLPAPGRYITEAEGRRLICGVSPDGSIEPEEPFGEPKKLRFIGRIG